MAYFYQTYIYQPILQALIFIYHHLAFNDLGLAIIILTVFIRIILLPFFYKSAKDQAILQKLSPQIKKIQTDHKENKQKQAQALMALYQTHRINPFSSILLLIIQLPIIIALYQVFLKGLSKEIFQSPTFLGFIDLGHSNIWMATLAALAQFFYGRVAMALQPKNSLAEKPQNSLNQKIFSKSNFNPQEMMAKTMNTLAPFLTLFILIPLPAAVGLYWGVSTIFSFVQQLIVNKKIGRQFKEKI